MAELVVPFAKREAAEALAYGEAADSKAARLEALDRFLATPVETSPLFVRHVMTEGAPLGAVHISPPAEARVRTEELEPGALGGHAKIVDGEVHEIGLSKHATAQGVRLRPLREVGMLPAGAAQQADKFFQLTRALYRDGLLLEVPKGVRLDAPVRVDVQQKAGGVASFTRLVVHLADGAFAEVLEAQTSVGDHPAVLGLTTEALVGEGAELHYNAVANLGPSVGTFLNREAVVQKRGRVRWGLGNFGGSLTKSLTHTALVGDDSEVKHTEVVFGALSQRFDISSFATHGGHRAKSDVLARAALRHKSRGNVKGMITISNSGIEADSYLGQFALLLDPEAKAIAIPGLEIETSQVVRAKHAAAVQQIDDAQVFYLESRGIPPQEARRLIVEGFLNPVIEGISSEDLRQEVHELIRSKWRQA